MQRETKMKENKKKSSEKKSSTANGGIKKEYLKSKNVCKVTFKLPGHVASEAKSVHIVGEFNNWAIHATPLKRLKNGDYSVALELEPGREYQFRYLIDESHWENDHQADKYIKSHFGDSDNSVVIV